MFCTACGLAVPDASRFCNHCGTSMTGALAQPPSPSRPSGPPVMFGEIGVRPHGQAVRDSPHDDKINSGFRVWIEMVDAHGVACSATGSRALAVLSVKDVNIPGIGPVDRDEESVGRLEAYSRKRPNEFRFQTFDVDPAQFTETRFRNEKGLDRPFLSWNHQQPQPVLKRQFSRWGSGLDEGLVMYAWFRPQSSGYRLFGRARFAFNWYHLPGI